MDTAPESVPLPVNGRQRQLLFPVVDGDRRLVGVVTRSVLEEARADGRSRCLADVMTVDPVVAYPDEPLRAVVYRMASTGLTRFPVVERGQGRRLVGVIGLFDLLQARVRNLEAERRRERTLRVRRRKKKATVEPVTGFSSSTG